MTKHPNDETKSSIPAFIDRIENDLAVIILSDEPEVYFDLPRQYLPPNVEAGDHLKLTFELDPESTEAARQRVAALQSELASETETIIKL
jgi:hypothetical protein